MADEMRLPIFRGDGYKDPDQHWFLCEGVWNIKNVLKSCFYLNYDGLYATKF